MSNIIIGKHTLESLTTGMYSDPYVVFREYIQNSADSIDNAIRLNIISSGTDEINIRLSPAERRIVISDNGTGISASVAEQTLISIGNSKKSSDLDRGFRGIGRLAALGYCSTLTFETSVVSEVKGTRIVIDSNRLSQLLTAKDNSDVTITDVLDQVYRTEYYPETSEKHYFRVVLDGVEESSGLNDYDSVVAYISQNAPVPYDPVLFTWGDEISRRLLREGLSINSYNISVSFGNITTTLFKPYKDSFLVDKGKKQFDQIQDIELVRIKQGDGTILAIGWIGKTSYLGSIYDKTVKGLRLRKGNILIGDSQTLNTVFKDARFNGWSIGELFVITPQLIPNARRDNFEKTPAYFVLMEQLQKIAVGITKEIRSISLSRNQDLSNALNRIVDTTQKAEDAIQNGMSLYARSKISQELSDAQRAIAASKVDDNAGFYYQEIAFDELDMLIGTLKGATSFKALNAITALTNTEKKILERVLAIIIKECGTDANRIIDVIVDEFSRKGAKYDIN